MPNLSKFLIIIGILVFFSNTAFARIIYVPEDSITIQSAIDGATKGDTILVTEGHYYERIIIHTDSLIIASEYILDNDTNHILNTIIDGDSLETPITNDTTNVIYIDSTYTTVIRGLTIQNGYSTYGDCIYNYYCLDAEITNCLMQNSIDSGNSVCSYYGNTKLLSCQLLSGGISCHYTDVVEPRFVTVSKCNIDGDLIPLSYYNSYSSFNIDSSYISGYIHCRGHSIINNSTVDGDIMSWVSSLSLSNSIINGYLTVSGDPGIRIVDSCVINGLHTINDYSDISIYNSLVTDTCYLAGLDPIVKFVNSTLLGKIYSQYNHLYLDSCIMFVPSDTVIYGDGIHLHANCCYIYNVNPSNWFIGTPDEIDTNQIYFQHPRFCNPDEGDYHLAENSPCAASNNNCGTLIGAYDVACDSIGLIWYVSNSGSDTIGNGTFENPFKTIQHAVNVSADCDTIMVADGTYSGEGNWDINISGKNIVLKSQNGPDYTIIDCNDISGHRGIIIENGEDSTTVVDGFTITNVNTSDAGGGIYIISSSPKIINCNFITNYTSNDGGGIYTKYASSIINNCSFIDNECGSTSFGSGIFCDSSELRLINCIMSGQFKNLYIIKNSVVEVDSCTIKSNFRALTIRNSYINVKSSSFIDNYNDMEGSFVSLSSQVILRDCLFESQTSEETGALECRSSNVNMVNCTFSKNKAGFFAAVWLTDTDFIIDSCTFSKNYTYASAKNIESPFYNTLKVGPAIGIGNSSGTINSCLFYKNYDTFYWRSTCLGVSLINSSPIISNCSFVENTGIGDSVDYIISCGTNSLPQIKNCIISSNEKASAVFCLDSFSIPIINCTDIYENEKGDWVEGIANQFNVNGNISLDPRFCDTANNDYHLASNSPCAAINNNYGVLIGKEDIGCDQITRIWYVSTSGNDTLGTGTQNNPLKTIQHAIDISFDGDTILALEGIYYERINFRGKAIVIGSVFMIDEDTNHIRNTIIDADTSVIGSTDTGSVVIFVNGENSNSKLIGFSITNGTGTLGKGGGILMYSGSGPYINPTINNCKIYNNSAQYGGGLYYDYGYITLDSCVIYDNNALGSACYISNGYSLTLNDCIVFNSNFRLGSEKMNRHLILNNSYLNNVNTSTTWNEEGQVTVNHSILAIVDVLGNINSNYSKYTNCSLGGDDVTVTMYKDSLINTGVGVWEYRAYFTKCFMDNVPLYIDDCAYIDSCFFRGSFGFISEGISIYDVSNSTVILTEPIDEYVWGAYFKNSIVVTNSTPLFSGISPQLHRIIINCTDIYGFEDENWLGGTPPAEFDTSNVIFYDPLFCDTTNNNYSIDSLSPCNPLSPLNPCDTLIGLYPPSCRIYADTDDDSIPDVIDICTDTDGDGYGNPGFLFNTCPDDNCPDIYNNNQEDSDLDGIGDSCDNCILIDNPLQEDTDSDNVGDSCDNCINLANSSQEDDDSDGVGNACDNCPQVANPDQIDYDEDGRGDSCDNCPEVPNYSQSDTDLDGVGDACDLCQGFDDNINNDGDTIPDGCDNCPFVDNPLQENMDGDEYGDACDDDIDGDEFVNSSDNCPYIYNPGQEDSNGDGIGDACCCLGYAGNADCSEVEQPDISDITRLIDYLYISHASLCCPDEADADASGGEPDISDITRLIDHLYLTHQSLPVCP